MSPSVKVTFAFHSGQGPYTPGSDRADTILGDINLLPGAAKTQLETL